jgi:precorrin-4 methylase
MIVVGKALGRDLRASKLYDRAFTHGFRKGKSGGEK